MPRITDLSLRSFPLPAKGHVTYWDQPLGVRVSATGVKTFIVILRSGRRHKIGRYGDISLAQAREAAKQLKAEKTLGRLLPSSVTLATAKEEYLTEIQVRPNTKTYYQRNLKRLTATKLSEITPKDINRILDSLGLASRAQALRSFTAFFNWCIRRHYLERSPCDRMVAAKTASRARVLSDEEIKRIWQSCGDDHFGSIVKLLVLTGQRRGEIAALQSSWIQTDAIIIPKEIAKNRRQHSVPIGALSAEILTTALQRSAAKHSLSERSSPAVRSRGSDSEINRYLFPARGNALSSFNGWSKSKASLDKKLGDQVEPWTLHDLRRTFATKLAELGVAPHIIERLINHVTGTISGVAAIYNRNKYLPEMRAAVQAWELHLTELLARPSDHALS